LENSYIFSILSTLNFFRDFNDRDDFSDGFDDCLAVESLHHTLANISSHIAGISKLFSFIVNFLSLFYINI